MKDKKYKLTDESIEVDGRTLYRIRALKDFGLIRKGEKGGFVESEANLSQEGDCWVGEKAKVFENAQVYENAKVFGNAKIYGEALTVNEVQVYGNVLLWGNVKVYGKTKLSGKIIIANAEICNSKFVILK